MMAMGIAAIEINQGSAEEHPLQQASSIAPKASTARRLNEPWDKPAPFEAAAPSTPLTAHDVSLAAQYKAEDDVPLAFILLLFITSCRPTTTHATPIPP